MKTKKGADTVKEVASKDRQAVPASKSETPITATPHIAAKIEITQQDIAARAYKIWQSEGCPVGKDHEHWVEAERQLRAGKR